jgi:hypothetical protein
MLTQEKENMKANDWNILEEWKIPLFQGYIMI